MTRKLRLEKYLTFSACQVIIMSLGDKIICNGSYFKHGSTMQMMPQNVIKFGTFQQTNSNHVSSYVFNNRKKIVILVLMAENDNPHFFLSHQLLFIFFK